MDAGVQLGEALQQRGIVLDLQSGGAAGATQGTGGVHVTAAARQAGTVGLQRDRGNTTGQRAQGLPSHVPLTAQEKHPRGSFIFLIFLVHIYINTYSICI